MVNPEPQSGKAKPLLKAEPLSPQPLPPQGAVAQPIPVSPIPAQPIPAAPIPLDSPAAASATAAPGAAARPIVLTGAQKQQLGPAVQDQGWRRGRKAVGIREEMEERDEEGSLALWWQNFIAQHQSFAISALVHAIGFVILGLLCFDLASRQINLVSDTTAEEPVFEETEVVVIDPPILEKVGNDVVDRPEPESLQPEIDNVSAMEGVNAASVKLDERAEEKAVLNDILSDLGRGTGNLNQRGKGKGRKGIGFGQDGTGHGLGGRGGRRGSAVARGATKESEEAVDLALQWLAEHQLADGGWSFNHHLAASCGGKCPNTGDMPQARLAATGLALLPFLGAGQTHQIGKYQKTVGPGLNYLITNMKIKREGGSLHEPGGRMYSHGLATIALCEAYGMLANGKKLEKMRLAAYDGSGEAPTLRDQKKNEVPVANLGRAAQAALNFVVTAQDPVGGGWRYEPKQAGDTSVVGWQLMGLLSGRMAYLQVPQSVFTGASRFLDTVQTDDYGANYGYTDKSKSSKATQAIGLLSRMYLGWKPENQGISQGVATMSAAGPSRRGDMYYNYYANQVMYHNGGEPWKKWNPAMRDWVTGAQSKSGHTAGSWHYTGPDRGSTKGGRLYDTAMSSMCLEVYYRHMPLGSKRAMEEAGRVKKEMAAAKAKKTEEKKEEL